MITEDIRYIGVNDHDIDLFEGQYQVPNGISYNSYVIMDEKIAIMDTVDKRKQTEFLGNLETALAGRTPDYLVISHMEPDHASSIQAVVERYPEITLVGNAKTFPMLKLYFDLDTSRALTVKEGDTLCIIEAMKIMNEIKAPCDGKVIRIMAQPGDMVEYNQVLCVIE